MTKYKGYVIEGDGTFGMKVIKYPGQGGTIPVCLSGSFSNDKIAKQSIDIYLTHKEEEENKPERIKKVKLYPREVKDDGATESDSSD